MMEKICTHPNVGAVVLVSLGCESFDRIQLAETIANSGRPVKTLVIQNDGGTARTIESGRATVQKMRNDLDQQTRVPMEIDELIIGTICGGSDATSGLTANPAIGQVVDRLVKKDAICIFEETGELIGCEQHLARRCVTPELGQEVVQAVEKAHHYYDVLGHASFSTGNAEGELTTQEEKSMGAYAKSGFSPISGLIKPADVPPRGGLYLLDVVPDGEVRFGFPNISDTAEIGEQIACGCHMVLFTTGRGSVVGSAISPVVKISGNPEMYDRLKDDMDLNAGAILSANVTLEEVSDKLFQIVLDTASGAPSKSENLGHQEFIMTYKSFDPIGPSCLPGN
jgi:altronate hydrolase